ncbi:MAG: ribokinase [Planctomycetota bacterium]|nr:ribokinase [Planctomycetota bacterium]
MHDAAFNPTPPMQVCVVGSANMDLVVRTARLPAPGETILGSAFRTFPGGKGANQAVAARRLGAGVSLVACIGDDSHGQRIRQSLEGEGLDLRCLAVRAGEPSGLAMITVAEGGQNTIVVSPGANARLSEEDIDRAGEQIRGCDVLLAQLEVPLVAVRRAIHLAREAGRAVILNAAPAKVLPPDLVREVDVLVVNRSEGARVVGMDSSIDPARIALRLPEVGAPTVILTLGAGGSIVVHRGRPRRLGAPHVKSLDATGAGDAFCGALAGAWGAVRRAEARSTEELRRVEAAVAFASAAGAAATMKAGALPSLPTRERVEALLAGGADPGPMKVAGPPAQ